MSTSPRRPHDGRHRALRQRAALLGALLLAGLALAPSSARAHGRSLSYSSWTLSEDGRARVTVRIPRLELTRVGLDAVASRPGSGAGAYLADRLWLATPDRACAREEPPAAGSARPGWAVFRWSVRCPRDADLRIQSAILLEAAPSHLHFARVRTPDGRVLERVLTKTSPTWQLASRRGGDPDDGASSLGAYLALGIEHILTGWDHLAFVLALVLLAGRLREVARLITGFTVAHSITLAAAVLGWAHPDRGAVEAVIGLSVALVAAENAYALGGRDPRIPRVAVAALLALAAAAACGVGALSVSTAVGLALFTGCYFALLDRVARPARLRAALAFVFGLVHGFGFAGVLAEVELPVERLAPALFGFNLGVEVGQLGVVAVVWPALRVLARVRDGRWYRAGAEVASAGICALGLFWLLTRALGA